MGVTKADTSIIYQGFICAVFCPVESLFEKYYGVKAFIGGSRFLCVIVLWLFLSYVEAVYTIVCGMHAFSVKFSEALKSSLMVDVRFCDGSGNDGCLSRDVPIQC